MANRALAVLGFTAVIISLSTACDRKTGPTPVEVQPQPGVTPAPTPAPTLRALVLVGPHVLDLGETGQLMAFQEFSDGSKVDVTSKVQWSTSTPSKVTVSPGGLVTARAIGNASVSANDDNTRTPPFSITVFTPATGPIATLTGTIFDASAGGRTPLIGASVRYELEVGEFFTSGRSGVTTTDAGGRYTFPKVPGGRQVKLFVRPAWNGTIQHCSATTILSGDTTLDVPFYASSGPLPSPKVSGQVFAMTSNGREPLAGVQVNYVTFGWGQDMSVTTDADGRYAFCGVPPRPGSIVLECWRNDSWWGWFPVDTREDTLIDIDATAFKPCQI